MPITGAIICSVEIEKNLFFVWRNLCKIESCAKWGNLNLFASTQTFDRLIEGCSNEFFGTLLRPGCFDGRENTLLRYIWRYQSPVVVYDDEVEAGLGLLLLHKRLLMFGQSVHLEFNWKWKKRIGKIKINALMGAERFREIDPWPV